LPGTPRKLPTIPKIDKEKQKTDKEKERYALWQMKSAAREKALTQGGPRRLKYAPLRGTARWINNGATYAKPVLTKMSNRTSEEGEGELVDQLTRLQLELRCSGRRENGLGVFLSSDHKKLKPGHLVASFHGSLRGGSVDDCGEETIELECGPLKGMFLVCDSNCVAYRINHARDSQLINVETKSTDDGRVDVIATRVLRRNDELFLNWGADYRVVVKPFMSRISCLANVESKVLMAAKETREDDFTAAVLNLSYNNSEV
jgi:hypothetical protein